MRDIQPKFHYRQTNRTVKTYDPKLNFWDFTYVVWKFNWQSMSRKLTPKMWYMSAIIINKPVQYEKSQHFDLNSAMNSDLKYKIQRIPI